MSVSPRPVQRGESSHPAVGERQWLGQLRGPHGLLLLQPVDLDHVLERLSNSIVVLGGRLGLYGISDLLLDVKRWQRCDYVVKHSDPARDCRLRSEPKEALFRFSKREIALVDPADDVLVEGEIGVAVAQPAVDLQMHVYQILVLGHPEQVRRVVRRAVPRHLARDGAGPLVHALLDDWQVERLLNHVLLGRILIDTHQRLEDRGINRLVARWVGLGPDCAWHLATGLRPQHRVALRDQRLPLGGQLLLLVLAHFGVFHRLPQRIFEPSAVGVKRVCEPLFDDLEIMLSERGRLHLGLGRLDLHHVADADRRDSGNGEWRRGIGQDLDRHAPRKALPKLHDGAGGELGLLLDLRTNRLPVTIVVELEDRRPHPE